MLKNSLKLLLSRMTQSRHASILSSLVAIVLSVTLAALSWWTLAPKTQPTIPQDKTHQMSSLFALNYPANAKFQKELFELKRNNQLKEIDELEIQKSVLASSEYLEIPPAILWCLLFQESRLNHLEGLNSDKSTLGLGQFSRFSFYEINHQQHYFDSNDSNLFFLMFGKDIRPVAAKQRDLVNASSYYHIPTAVVASSIYLHNRYYHLTRILDQKAVPYNQDLVWLFAAMAYNKGTRSVLNLWNSLYKKKGAEGLEKLLNNYEYFKKTTEDSVFLTKTLAKIWPDSKARAYSKELTYHTKNIASCSVSPVYQTTRSLMEIDP